MRRAIPTVAILLALGLVGGCSRRRPPARPAPSSATAPAPTQPSAGGTFARPDLGVRLDWPAGWAERHSQDFVLLLVRAPGGGGGGDGGASGAGTSIFNASISLDVPRLPPHIPGLIPIGSVRGGYLDDLRKSVGRIRPAELVPPQVGAAARFVRSTWSDDAGREWQETALLMVHGDRVYILRGRSIRADEEDTRAAFDEIVRSLKWTR